MRGDMIDSITTKMVRHRFTLLTNGLFNFGFIKYDELYMQIQLLSKSAIILQATYKDLEKKKKNECHTLSRANI